MTTHEAAMKVIDTNLDEDAAIRVVFGTARFINEFKSDAGLVNFDNMTGEALHTLTNMTKSNWLMLVGSKWAPRLWNGLKGQFEVEAPLMKNKAGVYK